jgi:hypothetical protein
LHCCYVAVEVSRNFLPRIQAVFERFHGRRCVMERLTHRSLLDWPAVSREAGTRDCTPATAGQQSAVFDGKTRDRVSSALYSLNVGSKVSDCVRASPSGDAKWNK